jgi:hypothetical protein
VDDPAKGILLGLGAAVALLAAGRPGEKCPGKALRASLVPVRGNLLGEGWERDSGGARGLGTWPGKSDRCVDSPTNGSLLGEYAWAAGEASNLRAGCVPANADRDVVWSLSSRAGGRHSCSRLSSVPSPVFTVFAGVREANFLADAAAGVCAGKEKGGASNDEGFGVETGGSEDLAPGDSTSE